MNPAPAAFAHQVVYQHPDYYCAWPALIRAANGDLLLTFIRTEQHLSPSGSIVAMRSTDNGVTWSEPAVIFDTLIDDRECGLTLLPDGRIALHIWSTFWRPEAYARLDPGSYPPADLERWIAQINRPEYRAAEENHGGWTIISADHGHTWTAPVRGPDTIHGGIALQDGSLLVASYRNDNGGIGLYAANQPEGPWRKQADVPCPTDTHYFAEPHVLQLRSGRILMMIRYVPHVYDDRSEDQHMHLSFSDDQGRTWSPATPTALLGFPPHLLELQDGRVLCSYGYRRAPFGERAALSPDGIHWDSRAEIILRDDNATHDLGYPASIEVAPGEILTVYYQKPTFDPASIHRHKPAIFSTRWQVPSA